MSGVGRARLGFTFNWPCSRIARVTQSYTPLVPPVGGKKEERKKKEGKKKKKKRRARDPVTRSEIRVLRDRDGYRCDNFRGELLPVKSEDGREGGKAKVEKNEYAE